MEQEIKKEEIGINIKEIDLNHIITGFADHFGVEFRSLNNPQGSSANNQVKSFLGFLSSLLKPSTKKDAIKMSIEWYESDDYLQSLIDFKVDMICNGMKVFSHYTKEERVVKMRELLQKEETFVFDILEELNDLNSYAEKFFKNFDLRNIVKTFVRDLIITDSAILYWRTDEITPNPEEEIIELMKPNEGPIIEVLCINPAYCEWINKGVDVLKFELPESLMELASSTTDKEKLLAILTSMNLPKKVILAIIDGSREVTMVNGEDGDNWSIKTKERKGEGLAYPSLTNLFQPLAIRMMFNDGEFGGASMFKNFIMHIKGGEAITNGPMAGSRDNYLSKDESKDLNEKFKKINKSTVITTNHTIEISFVFPEKEMFSREKFNSCESRIRNALGISEVLFSGDGGKYAGGYISLRRPTSFMSEIRSDVNESMDNLFQYEIDSGEKSGESGRFMMSISFNENTLKEPRQVSDEAKHLHGKGLISDVSVLSSLGRRSEDVFSTTVSRIANGIINNKFKVVEEDNDNNDNNINDNSVGRPPNDSTTPNEETRNKSPSSS